MQTTSNIKSTQPVAIHRITILMVALLAILLLWPHGVLAEARRDLRGTPTINYWTRYTDVVLELDASRFEEDTAIAVRYRITNRGYKIVRFYPAIRADRTFRFMVLDQNGREIAPRLQAGDYGQSNETMHVPGDQRVVNLMGQEVKEVILHPGETFEKRLNLSDFYNLKAGSSYRVSAYFWPDQREASLFVRSGNTARIQIDRAARRSDVQRHPMEREPGNDTSVLLSPEETIYLFLSAEMRSNWNNYLKYLDLNRFITAYDRYASRYVQASSARRPEVLAEFKRYLISRPADRLRKFKIVNSAPERMPDGQIRKDGRYEVTVQALREDGGYQASYEYVYTLEKVQDGRGNFWKIIYVTAQLKNRGG